MPNIWVSQQHLMPTQISQTLVNERDQTATPPPAACCGSAQYLSIHTVLKVLGCIPQVPFHIPPADAACALKLFLFSRVKNHLKTLLCLGNLFPSSVPEKSCTNRVNPNKRERDDCLKFNAKGSCTQVQGLSTAHLCIAQPALPHQPHPSQMSSMTNSCFPTSPPTFYMGSLLLDQLL